ncbi:MAG: Sjogren's syndrome/scleroderma autoantigen 1 family protein [Nitrososphaeraceae archaeon]
MSSEENDGNKKFGIRSAADLLTRGGTLIREPCESCNGVQIQFGNKLTCINCGNTREIEKKNDTISRSTSDYDKEKYRPTHDASIKLTSDTYENEFHDRLCTSVKERILDLIPDSKIDVSISEELTKAQLIEIYLRILERFEKI